jgi:hypothetical protein
VLCTIAAARQALIQLSSITNRVRLMSKGFGVKPLSKIDKLIEQAVHYAQKRSPESLDTIFDNLPLKLNSQVLNGAVVVLQDDIDT